MGKGTNTTTSSTTTAPSAQAGAAYSNVLNQAQGVAAAPYVPYTGELTAGVNQQQNTGIAGVNNYANAAQPAISQAEAQTQAASAPLTQAQIQQYMSPYTQDVVNSTQAQFNNQNAQQQQGVVGNAIAQGALGGNRSAIAQAETANQEQLAQAPVIAGLENQGYTTGLSTAENQQQLGLQGAAQTGNLGVAGQTAGMSGASNQIGAGTLQQQTQQAADTANYGQFQNQEAYPLQMTQWLAGIDTGVGSQMGGTSNGTTTAPAPSLLGQLLGAGTAAAGTLGATGAYGSSGWLTSALAGLAKGGVAQLEDFIKKASGGSVSGVAGYADGGAVRGYADGGYTSGVAAVPYAGARGYVPINSISHGSGAPHANAPAPYNPPANNAASQASSIGSLAKSIQSGMNSPQYGGGSAAAGDAYGGSSSNPLPGLDPSDYGQGYARGGVAGFDDGGTPTFDDRFGAAFPNQGVGAADDSTVINPDEPVRLDPDADERWRKGNPIPPLGTAPPSKKDDNDDDLPDAPAEGIAPSTALAYTDDSNRKHSTRGLPPEVAVGNSSGVAPLDHDHDPVDPNLSKKSNGVDLSSEGKLWPSLMSAGFGMMASRSPFWGNAVGEGGQAGMAAYSAQAKAEQEAKQHADQLQLERERLEKPYSEMTMAEKASDARAKLTQQGAQINQPVIIGADGKPITNPAYVAARHEVERDWQPKLQKIGVNARGDDVQGIYDPNTKRATDINGNPLTIVNGVVRAATPTGTAPSEGNPEPQSSLVPKPAGATASTSPYQPVASADAGQVPLSLQKVQSQAGYQTPPAAPHDFEPNAPVGSEASRNTKFLAEIAEQDPGYALALKKAADYELDPGKYASMIKGHRERFMNDVLKYDPNYNPQQVGLIYKAQAAFLPGTKTGDTVRSFNTAVSHLDTLKEAYNAVKNGDVQLFNKIKNTFETQFGYAPPNTLNGIAQIVGGEVVKATVGSQNALGDREELRKTLDRDLSTMQATDVIDKYQALMGGQLHSLKFAYEQGTHLHNFDEKYLLPRSQEVMKHIDAGSTPAGKPSLPDFLERAQAANPHATKDQLTDYYNKKYGTK